MRYGNMASAAAMASQMAAAQRRNDVQAAASELDAARQRIARQELLIQTLIAMLLEKGVCTREEFLDLAEEVDMLDGRLDGKLAESTDGNVCSKCGTRNTADKKSCMWCGTELDSDGGVIRHPKVGQ